ncbi:hypothetical protein [Treponema brennaborense]|uniref:hypothetical protein n=1 Tax=Treponema brennaborense TaxID=81028 RepID=UPI0012E9CB31|nr:hypothetical protein [Treponema brennaborense]
METLSTDPDKAMEGVYDKKTGNSDDDERVITTFNFYDPNTQPDNHKKSRCRAYLKNIILNK